MTPVSWITLDPTSHPTTSVSLRVTIHALGRPETRLSRTSVRRPSRPGNARRGQTRTRLRR